MKKKIFTTLVCMTLFSSLLIPVGVSAVGVPDSCTISTQNLNRIGADLTCDGTCTYNAANDCGMCCLLNVLYNVTDWIFIALIAISGIFIVIGAMQMVTAGGDPTKLEGGRKYVIYAAIGLVVSFLARAIPGIAKMISGA